MFFHRFAGIFLIPVLAAEGFYVRWKTPRLPEPEGTRFGIKGCGEEISLLVLGDSAALGVGAKKQENALSGQLTDALSEKYRVTWKLFAKNGMRSKGLLWELIHSPFEKFDYVVVSIGTNDVTHGTKKEDWEENLKNLLSLIKGKFRAHRIFLTSIPPMHLFPALPQPLRWWIGKKAEFLNDIMEKVVKRDERTEIVNMETPFEKAYMAEDGFHPSEATYALWGRVMAEAIGKVQGK